MLSTEPQTDLPSSNSHPNSPTSSTNDPMPEGVLLNPFKLQNKIPNKRHSKLIESLKFNAVEVSVECSPLGRRDLFSKSEYFVVLFIEGASKGTWQPQQKSEPQNCETGARFLQKFSLRAATEVDRMETIIIAFLHVSELQAQPSFQKAYAFQEFTVSELVTASQMMLQKQLRNEKGQIMNGEVLLALDLVQHVEEKHSISIEFGCLGNAPIPNRIFFVLSRALRRGRWSPIYKSEMKLRSDATKFETISFDSQQFHGGDPNKLFRLEVYRGYKNGRDKLLGFMQISTVKLFGAQPNDEIYWWPTQEGLTGVRIMVQEINYTKDDRWFSLRLAGAN